MAMRNRKWLGSRRAAIALAIGVVATLLPLAARAQFFGGWDDRQRHQQGGGFFPFFDRPYSPPQPCTIVVVGDSLADWLAYGLEEIYADQPQLGVERRIRPNSGLIHYEPRNDALEWSQAIKDILATEKPAAIVVMLGLNDRVPLKLQSREAKPEGKQLPVGANTAAQGKPEGKQPAAGANTPAPAGQTAQPQGQDAKAVTQPVPPAAAAAQQSEEAPAVAAAEPQRPMPGGTYEFHTDEWAELYGKRIDDMIAVLKSKGVPVLWVGLPAVRGPRATGEMSYLDDLFHARADKAGIVYVDVWDGFVDENGRYTVQGPDFEGQIRRLRSGDGVHFSKAGAEKLAHYVEHELARVMANPLVPVALPVPEATAPAAAATPGAARPTVGPVLPLAATGTGEGGDLLGAGSRPSPASPDATAASILVRGEALAAPAGRADDFTWPRSSSSASAKPAQKAKPVPPSIASAPAPASAASAPAPAQAATPALLGAPAAQ
jgi:lysophospholipase L1-like esterase